MARDDLHFRLRLPEEIKLKIEEAAEANRRSMTAEIVARLEESFQPDMFGVPKGAQPEIKEILVSTRRIMDLLTKDMPPEQRAAFEGRRRKRRIDVD